jgi:hypothetical protein
MGTSSGHGHPVRQVQVTALGRAKDAKEVERNDGRQLMTSIDADALKGMLQSLEHTLSALDGASAVAAQLIDAQRTGKPLSPKTLAAYEEQFATTHQTAGAHAYCHREMVDAP